MRERGGRRKKGSRGNLWKSFWGKVSSEETVDSRQLKVESGNSKIQLLSLDTFSSGLKPQQTKIKTRTPKTQGCGTRILCNFALWRRNSEYAIVSESLGFD
jgi:hypothetical protein